MIRTLFIYLICMTPLFAAESGYRIVHPDGTVEFTDEPREGAEPITLPEVPTYSPTTTDRTTPSGVSTVDSNTGEKNENEPEKERTISVVSPAAEETVWFNADGMTVSVQVSPPLGEGQQVQVRLDGSVVAAGSQSSFTLKQVYRGTHTISASIIDAQGSVISESSPITFYMRQHSVLDPK